MLALLCEWGGCVMGLLGAALLASNTEHSRLGWFAFLVANFLMITFSVLIDKHGLLLQQIGFCLTSCLGIYRAFRPAARFWGRS